MKKINPVNSFSAARFAILLKFGLRSSEFHLLLVGVCVMNLGYLLTTYISNATPYEILCDLRDYVYAVLGFCLTFGASLIVSSLKNKGNRINHLMLPATMGEKFLARFVIMLFGTILAVFIAFLALYAVLATISVFSQSTPTYADYNLFTHTTETLQIHNAKTWQALTLIALFFVWIYSTYLLGGILWKGKSWIITSILLLFLSMAFGMFFVSFSDVGLSIICNEVSSTVFFIVFSTILAIFIIVNFSLAWYLFKRMQVVRPTLRNFVKGIKRHF